MPRTTCRSSECVGNGNDNGNNDDTSDATTTNTIGINNNNNNNTSYGINGGNNMVKQEFDAAPPVCHRKSERRRVARDIFLVFEEQTTRRRGRGGARGKNSRAKQKFGHLKVANTPRINKNLLREIKTEPKCTMTQAAVPAIVVTTPTATTPCNVALSPTSPVQSNDALAGKQTKARTAAVKLETKTASNAATVKTTSSTDEATTSLGVTANRLAEQEPQQLAVASPNSPTMPSVNPIFLWVKQDDTRIVEVRCEDYDKRNRIRLTKTTNGWRSMPRTDASSTRIVKFFHSAATPLMKVKREVYESQQHQEEELLEQQQLQHVEQQQQPASDDDEVEDEEEQQQQMLHEPTPTMLPTLTQNLLQDWDDSATQLPDEEEQEVAEDEEVNNLAAVIENVVVMPASNVSKVETETETLAVPAVSDVCFDALLDSETNASTKATKTSTNTPTYQSSTPSPMELQLCPKTGLFMTKTGVATAPTELNAIGDEASDNAQHLEKSLLEQVTLVPENQNKPQPEPSVDQTESLDANTKNLKDLLDDADLLQNCSSDNGSNGADLLDSLVKRSCEDNLVQNSSATADAQNVAATASALSSFCVPDMDKDLPSILDMDNDAPKCLSFNEAGEIEGLNGELFHETHSHSFSIDAFEKQSDIAVVLPTPTTVELTETPTPPSIVKDVVVPDETPKDLSYKKREEVCPPSESRSQCAVTSSSDILKSPERLEMDASGIPAEVETTSETIKHLILEQFLKLNALNQLPNAAAASGGGIQQAEPMDLGKAREKLSTASGKYLETVVIDDEEEAPPLKKRSKANIKLDRDPDALTQLKMLIANPQWKVPDPILVPKDRLGAVLASPAREIPLLLTTRPELRLPEAFAYPEIIQNPNILVVTMEQLEAILKNDVDQSRPTKLPQPADAAVVVVDPPISKVPSAIKQSATLPHKVAHPAPKPTPVTTATAPASPADSSMSTDLNATTLALLQQMLWLPYFGQLSQEFFKTLKDPLGLQRKFMSNLLPFYNSQFGLQHLDELYKHCLKQKSTEEQAAVTTKARAAPPTPPASASAAAVAAAAAAASSSNFNGFSNPMELAIMQKLLQPQLPNFLGWAEQQSTTAAAGKGHNSNAEPSQHHLEHKRARRDCSAASGSSSSVGSESTPLHIPDFNSNFNKAKQQLTAEQQQPPQPAPVEHKPRLTCKSLSNLLEPEGNSVPLLNVPFDGLHRASLHKAPLDSQQTAGKEPSNGRTLRSSKACVTYNPLEQSRQPSQLTQQQRKRSSLLHEVQQQQQHQQLATEAAARGMADAGAIDANSALWHPLFGSNPKQGYNSPWQWTTVTATGE